MRLFAFSCQTMAPCARTRATLATAWCSALALLALVGTSAAAEGGGEESFGNPHNQETNNKDEMDA